MTEQSTFWRGILQLADPKIWTASMIPFTVGSSIAASHGYSLRPLLMLSAIIVLVLVETGKNGVNEYFDYESGADLFVMDQDRTAFSGGKKVIVDRMLTPRQVIWISVICFVLAILFSIPVIWHRPALLLFGAVGVFSSIEYSSPPFRLCYRGWGEAAVGFTFGPVIVSGAYYLSAGRLAAEPMLLSVPLGFLITNVLWINEIPDVEADRRAKKWNQVARRGREGSVSGYITLFLLAAVSLIASALFLHHYFYLLALVGFAPGLAAIRCARQQVLHTQKLIRANGMTILVYALVGLLISIAAFL